MNFKIKEPPRMEEGRLNGSRLAREGVAAERVMAPHMPYGTCDDVASIVCSRAAYV